MEKLYFDNAATTKPFEEVYNVVLEIMRDEYYNPSSPYKDAMKIERKIDSIRDDVLKALNAKGRIVFTSGGSESNNLAIRGSISKMKSPKIITSAVEHPSVYNTCVQVGKDYGLEVIILPVNNKGYIIEEELISEVSSCEQCFVSIMHVNNETGTIQDINKLSKITKDINENSIFHVDGVQGFMKVPISLKDSFVDLYSISAHKIHGPKGVGALYVKNDKLLNPVTFGGGQEDNYRSGTHNTQGICGLGKALEIMMQNHNEYVEKMSSIKNIILSAFNEADVDYIICGDSPEKTAPHILNLAFMKIKGEVLLSAVDAMELIANTGSACSSKKIKVSRVLSEMKVDRNYIEGALRLSFGAFTTEGEAKKASQIIIQNVKRLRRFT